MVDQWRASFVPWASTRLTLRDASHAAAASTSPRRARHTASSAQVISFSHIQGGCAAMPARAARGPLPGRARRACHRDPKTRAAGGPIPKLVSAQLALAAVTRTSPTKTTASTVQWARRQRQTAGVVFRDAQAGRTPNEPRSASCSSQLTQARIVSRATPVPLPSLRSTAQ